MAYDVFLLVMSQLAGRRKARAVVEGEIIFFEAFPKKNRLTLYTKIFSGDGDLPPGVCSCVSSSGVLRWQHSGAWLKLDRDACAIYLFQEVEMQENKYLPFRYHLTEFTRSASEWREILRELADRDGCSVRYC
jgi:hypothetical protein